MVQRWEIDRTEYLITEERWRLRSDTCRRADGAEVAPVYVMEVPLDAANVFALTRDREVILLREYHHAARLVALGIPAGGLEVDETPVRGAHRELLEETGYAAGRLHSLGSSYMNWRLQTNRVHHFVALDCEPTGAQALDEHEDIEVVLTPLAEFDPMTLQQGYHLACALLALRELGANE